MSVRRRQLVLSAEERRRSEEVDRLAASGPAGVPALVEMLSDPSWTVRRGVVASLAALGDAAAAALCEVLRSRRDSEARIAAAVDALVASIGDVEDAVLALTGDADPAIVADAAQILGRRRSLRAVSRLAELTVHEDENVAVAAIEALGHIGGRAAVDSLVTAVACGNFFRTFPAIDVLGRSGDPRAVAPLAALLDDTRYLREAARGLGRTGSRSAVAPLAALLSRPGDAIVRIAAVALAELRGRYCERYGAAEPLDEALRHAAPVPASARRFAHGLSGADTEEQAALCVVLGVLGSDVAVANLTALLDGAPPAAPPVAAAAAESLAQLGRSVDERVLKALREGDRSRRLLLLPLVTGGQAAGEVIRCIDDPSPDVRAAACEALARISSSEAAPALFGLLEDPNARVVHAALSALQSFSSSDVEPLALAAARDGPPATRRAALQILAYFGCPSALPVFLDCLGHPDLRLRERAIQGLPFLADPMSLDALLAVARDPQERMRAAAMRALGQAAAAPRVLSCLLSGLEDRAAWVRYYACQSLGRLGQPTAVEAVMERLGDESGQVRIAAVEALSGMKTDAAIAALEEAVRDPNPDMRRAALIGLGLAGRRESLPTLLQATSSDEVATRLVAVSAVGGLASSSEGVPEVLPALVRAAHDVDESVRAAATGFLVARPGVDATRSLIALIGDGAGARAPLLAALSAPVAGRIEGILDVLATADDELSPLLTSALARMRLPGATAALFEALRLPHAPARKAAVTTLAAVATKEAFLAVEQLSQTDPDLEVQQIAALVLAQWST